MTGWRHTTSRHARGYGSDWTRLRLQVLTDEPLCRMCSAEGRVTAAREVDHIKPFNGLADPLRLDPDNCRPLCTPCHRHRTGRQSTGRDALRAVGPDGWPIG
jgi:5-methylcytosine-specific restriction protein A